MNQNSNRQNDVNTLVGAMFDEPFRYRSIVEKIVSRNKKLSSKIRRELTGFAYGAFKWRARLWDEKPVEPNFENIQSQIDAFQTETLAQTQDLVKKLPALSEQAKHLSYPEWLLQKWIEGYGFEKAVEIAWTQNQESKLCVRVNGTSENVEPFIKAMNSEGVEVVPGNVWSAYYIPKKMNIRGMASFKRGMFEVQDEHSQQVCAWTNPRRKDLIVDGCARTGGKGLNLAALQNNEGRVVCLDVDARVFEELENRAKRLGIKTIETRWIGKDDQTPCADLKDKADIVFVDAPCSGTGTIRHNPSIKWSLNVDDLQNFQKTQIDILNRQSRWVKPKGMLAYVTCSNLKEENETVIDSFLQGNPQFTIVDQKKLLPIENGGDGFFFTKLQKNSNQ